MGSQRLFDALRQRQLFAGHGGDAEQKQAAAQSQGVDFFPHVSHLVE